VRVHKEVSRYKRDVSFTLGLFSYSSNPPSSSILVRRATYIEARNTFLLPEVIFDLSLVLSLHVALLGLIFTNNTFLALSLTLAERISKLDIPPSYK
jgi:hypothetical protein